MADQVDPFKSVDYSKEVEAIKKQTDRQKKLDLFFKLFDNWKNEGIKVFYATRVRTARSNIELNGIADQILQTKQDEL